MHETIPWEKAGDIVVKSERRPRNEKKDAT
jgi:hypothetical protein